MSLANALGRHVVARGKENEPAWDGKTPGRYEVWFLTFNEPNQRAGFWLRYTLEAPLNDAPYAELWGNFFDGKSPAKSFGLRRRWPRADFALGGAALIQIGPSRLNEGRAVGALEGHGHSLSWDVSFDRSPTVYMVTPLALRPIVSRLRTNLCVPNGDVKYRGRVVADGRTFELSGAPGQQSHLWGGRHAKEWQWLHCNAFDGGSRTEIEALSPTLPFAGADRKLTLVYIRHDGRDYLCNALPQAITNARSDVVFPEWRFECRANGTQFHGVARADPRCMLQVEYADPDGTRRYCCNSEVSELELTIERDGGPAEVLRASGTAHLEFGAAQPRGDVPLCPGPIP